MGFVVGTLFQWKLSCSLLNIFVGERLLLEGQAAEGGASLRRTLLLLIPVSKEAAGDKPVLAWGSIAFGG